MMTPPDYDAVASVLVTHRAAYREQEHRTQRRTAC